MERSRVEQIHAEVEKTTQIMKKGGVVLYPTDTIWGLGCDAKNKKAVDKIYKIKHRVAEKSLIILLGSYCDLDLYVENVPDFLDDFTSQFSAPLTIIYPKAKNLPKSIIAPDGSIAIRVVKDDFCQELIKNFGGPIVSTSANISGDISPLYYAMIKPEIISKVDYVVDYKRDKITEIRPSTIVKITDEGLIDIIRN